MNHPEHQEGGNQMAQSKELMALRMRLTRRGYTNVSIEIYGADRDGNMYMIKAIEPLGGMGVQRLIGEEEISTVGRW